MHGVAAPLVFDLEADPSEANPIDLSKIPTVLAAAQAEYAKFWDSVNSTLRHVTDYSQKPWARPCGNHSSDVCRTHA